MMTTKKKIEVLIAVKAVVQSDKFGKYDRGLIRGLCPIAWRWMSEALANPNKISIEQMEWFLDIIPERRPYLGYCWKPGMKTARVKWLDKQIRFWKRVQNIKKKRK